MDRNKTKKIAVSAMLIALSYIVTIITASFKVAGFLSFDLKDTILSMISLLYGPLYGIVSIMVVALIEFISISSTGVYGLIMNILSSGTFVLVCGFVYKYKRSFSGAIISAVLTVLAVTAVMITANVFITPLYVDAPRQVVIDMIPTVLLPFNLCKTITNASLMLLIYKPFVSALRHTGLAKAVDNNVYKFSKKSLILTICAIAFLVVAICVILSLGVEIK